jgi:hypothetical protein
MLERESAATVWEMWSEDINDMRKYASHFELGWGWPLSLCHGWGAGAIPIATRHLLGIEPLEPGWRRMRLDPALSIPWSWQAELPTPYGPIRAERPRRGGKIRYRVPRRIKVDPFPGTAWEVELY